MKMNESQNLPYWWSASLGFFSLLSLQDYVFILGAVISALFTIKTYYAKRREEKARLAEERRRTQLMAVYLGNISRLPPEERPSAAEIIGETAKRANGHEQA